MCLAEAIVMALKLELAQEILLNAVAAGPIETIGLEECWRRVLAESLVSDMDFPPFDRSPLDGYAVIAADVAKASRSQPVILREVDNVPAGATPQRMVTAGTASRIMTGAPIPAGATGVIRLEDVAKDRDTIRVFSGKDVEGSICFQGEEIKEGETLIPVGTVINSGVMGMLAVMGKANPAVFKKPCVALIATGSEIISVAAPLLPGKIRNSNSYMLSAQVCDAGGQITFLGTAPDDVREIIQVINEAPESDVYITTGGASVGDYDLIGEVFNRLGITILFERVSIKPGMPVLAGIKDGKLYIGLSGNPAAASISFEQVVRPVIAKMSGRSNWWRPVVRAVLAAPFAKSTGAKRFVWSRCWQRGVDILVEPLGLQGNGMLKSAVAANSLLVIPENSPPLSTGLEVEVILLTDLNF